MSSALYLLPKWLLLWLKCWITLWLVPLRCCPWYVHWWVYVWLYVYCEIWFDAKHVPSRCAHIAQEHLSLHNAAKAHCWKSRWTCSESHKFISLNRFRILAQTLCKDLGRRWSPKHWQDTLYNTTHFIPIFTLSKPLILWNWALYFIHHGFVTLIARSLRTYSVSL